MSATRRVIAHDKFHRLVEHPGGNLTVSVEQNRDEHHMTVRSDALRWARAQLPAPEGGSAWVIGDYLGPEKYRRHDGHAAVARRYSIVYMGINQPAVSPTNAAVGS